jgi:methionyl aminopeptidase
VPDDTPLKDGDIINVDVTVLLNGYHGDCSATYYVGSGTPPQIIKAAYEAMMSGIKMVRPGAFTGDIGWASENTARLYGMHTVNGIGGHGIGKKFHSDPHIPGCGPFGSGIQLRSGICITVEPIVCQNNVGYDCVTIPGCDITTCISKDKSLAAQFEHTVLITPNGYDILTLP